MRFSFRGDRGNLYYSAIAANLASLAVGTHYSWSSPTLSKLEESDSWLPITTEEASWIGSLTSLGTAVGPFIGGWLINFIGRRWSIVTSVAISTIAWIILIFSQSVWQIYLGRLVAGVGGGISFLAIPTYVAEIAEPAVRGALGSLFAFFLVGGYMIEYACGPYVSYTILICINFVPAVVFLLVFIMAPESPYFYLRKEDPDSALESLTWLRSGRSSQAVRLELDELQEELNKSLMVKARLSDLFRTRGSLMALFLSCAMVGGQQFSGVNIVLFYGQQIFEMAGSTISDSICQIIIGAILFVCGGLSIPLTRLFGMKNMLIASAIGMAIFQAILGVYFYFYAMNYDMSNIGWLPLISMMGYIFIYTVGFGPLPWAVMGEVFTTKVKGLGSAITAAFGWFVSFLLTKFFNDIVEALNASVPFFFFAVCCILSLILTVIYLPDTRNMTLQEIWNLLDKKPESKTQDKLEPPSTDL